ncbi:MAG: prephenate dehydrogenase/arogenate dehydrogenase family protein [Deltaproteobacteria bacterium HGW-Deltaproteobacteria-12]|jgi:prephenate dehydrogenase|nr:MAG: prephenate dehydrogenase/arogenate dehydrogenase family protein [Deltaproteobacteria bacterium HGW-Deltaproteobacteria-12]
MKDAVIGIIGGTGGMGRWFARLLRKEGYKVHVCGRKTRLKISDLAGSCNVIVVAVPIAATAEVIRQVGPLMSADSLLMDLTSLKKEPVELMLSCSRAEIIGCHPLFGPQLSDVRGQNVVLCPARGDKWLSWLKVILERKGLIVIEKAPEEHDEMMAIVQVLNHLNTISFGLALAAAGIDLTEINKLSTPIFQTKMEIVKKVFTENPGLYTDIIAQNPAAMNMLDLYEKALADIRALVNSGDGTQLKEAMEQAAKKLF